MMMPGIFGDNMFDDFFDGFQRSMPKREKVTHQAVIMKTDVKELPESYELCIDLPGVKKEDVKAELKNGYLTVSAVYGTQNEEKDDNAKYIRRERYYGSAQRTFYVGNFVKQEDIKAKFENGILSLDVPKDEKYQAVEENNYITIEG